MLEVPLSEIIESMKAAPYQDKAQTYHSCGLLCGYHMKASTHSQTLAGKLETIEKKVTICLDCQLTVYEAVTQQHPAAGSRFQHK